MYKILYEINHYDGPIKGICSDDHGVYLYALQETENLLNDHPRVYYLYDLSGGHDGNPFTWMTVISEENFNSRT